METIKEGFLKKNIGLGYAGASQELENAKNILMDKSKYFRDRDRLANRTRYIGPGGILAKDLIKLLAVDIPELSDCNYLKIDIDKTVYFGQSDKWNLRFAFAKDLTTIILYKHLITDGDIYEVDKYKTFPIFLKKVVEPIFKDVDTFRDYINKKWG